MADLLAAAGDSVVAEHNVLTEHIVVATKLSTFGYTTVVAQTPIMVVAV